MDSSIDIDNILTAANHIDPVFLHSAIVADAELDAVLGCHLLAKLEIDNPIGSFKGRGTELFAAMALNDGEPIVCASAGNFGQGLARAATRRRHRCTVFAAVSANPLKIDAMRRLGADVRLAGADFDAAKNAARVFAADNMIRYVEDGAEPAIAEGAGTIALELADAAEFDQILVPLGNGALLGGIGTVLRHVAARTAIVAVVAANAPAMKLSIESGRVVETGRANTIADGIAVRVPIASTLALLRACCDDVVVVTDEQIFAAMQLIYRYLGLIIEPAGVVGVAAILADPTRFAGQRVATILCGGNIDDHLRARLLAT